MAQLNDTIITGSLSVTNVIYGMVTCVAIDNYSASADRPIMISCGSSNYEKIGKSSNCPLTFNPANGVLTATCFCGRATNSVCLNGYGVCVDGCSATVVARDSNGYIKASGYCGTFIAPNCQNTSFCIYSRPAGGCVMVACAQSNGLLYQRAWGVNSNTAYKIPFLSLTGTQTVSTYSELTYFGVDTEDTFTYNPSQNMLKVGALNAGTISSVVHVISSSCYTFTCNQGSDTGTNWFVCCVKVDSAHCRGCAEIWNCTNMGCGASKAFSLKIDTTAYSKPTSAMFIMMCTCDNATGGPETRANVQSTGTMCFGVYNRNSGTKLYCPHFLLTWWY